MLRIRIFTAGAVMAVILAVSSGAIAQNNEQPGKPLALLAGLTPPHEKKTIVHARTAHNATAKRVRKQTAKLANAAAAKASADAAPAPAPPAPSTLPENLWPAPDQATPANVAAEPAAEPAPPPAAAADDPDLGAVVVNGQTVQIKPADQINEIDLAAGDQNVDAGAAAPTDHAEAAPAAAPVVAVAASEAASKAASPVGSASWIAQVMAALGGAIAAGSVAWFLIGSGPQRTYG